jgi:recombination protein RecR
MALKLLGWPNAELTALAEALHQATTRVSPCPACGCLAQDGAVCAVCADQLRDTGLICVVESPLDAIALERGGGFRGVYHVLGAALSPLRGVLPEDLRIAELLARVRTGAVREVIVATNANPDGEATALYLKQVLLQNRGEQEAQSSPATDDISTSLYGDPHVEQPLRITRLARGLPSGGQLDYADVATLTSAIEHRTDL